MFLGMLTQNKLDEILNDEGKGRISQLVDELHR